MDSWSGSIHAPAPVISRTALLLAIVGLVAPARAETGTRTHVVYSGQRLGSIAKRYGISVEAICNANDLKPTQTLKPGLRLVIPERGEIVPARSESSRAHIGLTRDDKRHRNATPSDRSEPMDRTHRVEPGQRLESIAKRYGVPVDALRSANHIGEKGLIRPGQVLKIPDKDGHVVESDVSSHGYMRAPGRPGVVELVGYNERYRGSLFDRRGKLSSSGYDAASRVLAATGDRPRLDPRLLRLLVNVSDTFGGRPIRVVSGFRTTSFFRDSRHKHSQAIDFSIQGVPNEVVRDYLRSLGKVGVGYYPNSSFVHLDVRENAAYWVDYAGPGEAPRRNRHGSDPGDMHEEEPDDVPEATAKLASAESSAHGAAQSETATNASLPSIVPGLDSPASASHSVSSAAMRQPTLP